MKIFLTLHVIACYQHIYLNAYAKSNINSYLLSEHSSPQNEEQFSSQYTLQIANWNPCLSNIFHKWSSKMQQVGTSLTFFVLLISDLVLHIHDTSLHSLCSVRSVLVENKDKQKAQIDNYRSHKYAINNIQHADKHFLPQSATPSTESTGLIETPDMNRWSPIKYNK